MAHLYHPSSNYLQFLANLAAKAVKIDKFDSVGILRIIPFCQFPILPLFYFPKPQNTDYIYISKYLGCRLQKSISLQNQKKSSLRFASIFFDLLSSLCSPTSSLESIDEHNRP